MKLEKFNEHFEEYEEEEHNLSELECDNIRYKNDLFNRNIENILDVKVMRTVVGGKEVYTKYKTGE